MGDDHAEVANRKIAVPVLLIVRRLVSQRQLTAYQRGLAATRKPNIVLVLMDNFGWGEIGAYGGGELRGAPTPNIDSIAAEGIAAHQLQRRG